jgi:Subtilase family/Secretion system C-terminal sorting domain/CUB domain
LRLTQSLYYEITLPPVAFSGIYIRANPAAAPKIIQQTNTAYLTSFSAKSSRLFSDNKKKAFALAAIYNWPKFIQVDSTYSELMGVTGFNKPVYYTTSNRGAGITSRANRLYSSGGLGLSIEGQNMLAGVWDAGAALPNHELFTGRVQVMDGNNQSHPHATHVMGTVIGTDAVQNGNARGMAFKANAHSYDWNDDLSETAEAAANGLLLSNHSYGYQPEFLSEDAFGKYDDYAAGVDDVLFNAPYYQLVVAAGNSNGQGYNPDKNGYDLLAGMGLSKNAITVAAIHEVPVYTGPASVELAYFSSWGPTDDGRIKPDVSAKGWGTFSSVDSSPASYDTYSGTSMAAPSVTGTLLLWQQYYNEKNGNFMKAATLRGLMIHSADEAGDAPGPDYRFGWGLINAEKAASVIGKDNFQSVILQNTLTEGTTFIKNVTALGNGPLVATLCWTDPAGNPTNNEEVDDATAMIVNDLDVRITKAATTYMPWKLDPANPAGAATQGDNLVDNVEKIQVTNPTGEYTVTVSYKGTLVNQLQNYSLIISGLRVRSFLPSVAEDTKAICNSTNQVGYDFTLAVQPDFTQLITFSVPNLPAGVTAIFSTPSLSASGNFSLTLGNLTALVPGAYTFIVRATSGSSIEEIPVTLTIYAPIIAPVVLVDPANGTSLQQPVHFTWNGISNALNYEIQVATDAAFQNIVLTDAVTTDYYLAEDLEHNTPYFWRVRAVNTCGQGPYSATGSFTTTCATPTDFTLVTATTTTATIGWSQNTGAENWDVQIVPQGAMPVNTGITTTSNPYTFTGLTVNTCYDFYIRSGCPNGFETIWAGPFTFCTTPDYCAGDHFYDMGGPDNEYDDNQTITTFIQPGNAGERVKAIFNSFSLETDFDYLYVYDGPDTSATLIYALTGTNAPGAIVSTHESGALTFVFASDQYVTDAGWDISIICEPKPDYCGGAHFYDTGGVSGEYSGNQNYATTILPETAGERVKAIFNSFNVEEDYDYLYIYNGTDTSAEQLYSGTGTNSPGTVAATNPAGALTFVFVSDEGTTAAGWDATIVCEPMPPCSFSPTGIYVSNIATTSAMLSWTENNAAISWNIQVVPQGQAPAATVTLTNSNPYIATGLTPAACYDFYIQSACSNGTSAWVGPYTFCTLPDYCGGSHFYDTGGATGGYSDYEDYTTTILPGATGQRVRANFTVFATEQDYDYLYIYNGPNTSSPLLFTATGTNSPGSVVSTHPTGALTFRFTSDGGTNGAGWDAAIVCEPIPPCGISVSSLTTSSITETQATFAWTENNPGALSWEVQLVPQGSTPPVNGTPSSQNMYTATGLTSNTCYELYIKTICSQGSSWSGPFTFCTPANYCGGDHFYDNGGASGNYQDNENSTTVIYPQNAGDRVKAIFNSFETEPGFDFLSIYNGPDASAPSLFSGAIGTSPGTVASTHPSGALTFVFTSDDSNTYSGWDATIICEPLPDCNSVPLNVMQVAASATSATFAWDEANATSSWEVYVVPQGSTPAGDATVITANPYTVTGLDVNACYDFYIRSVCADGTSGWSGPLTFCTNEANCGGHFYDTGGAIGSYSDNENTVTTIYTNATGNAVTAVFNTFQLEDCCDYLRIYNGPTTNHPLLFMGNGNASPGTVTSTHLSGALTFWFTSNDGATFSGWDASIVCNTLSTDEPVKQSTINCYPNPVTNELTVHAASLIEHYEVYDIMGKQVLSQRAGQKDFLIDFSPYSAGAYFIMLHTNEGEILHLKVLKN